MIYVDQKYYDEVWLTGVVPQTAFMLVSRQASARLDAATFHNIELEEVEIATGELDENDEPIFEIVQKILERYREPVQQACCAVMDILYTQFGDIGTAVEAQSGVIISEHVGRHIVGYSQSRGAKTPDLLITEAIQLYLWPTGLLFAGTYCQRAGWSRVN